jgi:predicted DNA-binding transcriptional regulator
VYLILWIILPVKSSVDLPPTEVIEENKSEIGKEIKKSAKKFAKKVKSDTKAK